MADANIRLSWTVTTDYTTVVTPDELRVALLEMLVPAAPNRAQWDQQITNASTDELADLAADLTIGRAAFNVAAVENWLAARASNNRASEGADEFDVVEVEKTDEQPD